MTEKRCENCRYLHEVVGHESCPMTGRPWAIVKRRECRRGAPFRTFFTRLWWPRVDYPADTWCGEHAPKDEESSER